MLAQSNNPATKSIGLLLGAAYCGGLAYYFVGVRGDFGGFSDPVLDKTINGLMLGAGLLGFFAIANAIRGWAFKGQPATSGGYGRSVIQLVVVLITFYSLYLRSPLQIGAAEGGGAPSTEGLEPILLGFVAAGVIAGLTWLRARKSKPSAAASAGSFEPNNEWANPEADAIIVRYLASGSKDRVEPRWNRKARPDTPRGPMTFGRR
jgi:hypothetical protein